MQLYEELWKERLAEARLNRQLNQFAKAALWDFRDWLYTFLPDIADNMLNPAYSNVGMKSIYEYPSSKSWPKIEIHIKSIIDEDSQRAYEYYGGVALLDNNVIKLSLDITLSRAEWFLMKSAMEHGARIRKYGKGYSRYYKEYAWFQRVFFQGVMEDTYESIIHETVHFDDDKRYPEMFNVDTYIDMNTDFLGYLKQVPEIRAYALQIYLQARRKRTPFKQELKLFHDALVEGAKSFKMSNYKDHKSAITWLLKKTLRSMGYKHIN